MCCNQSTTFGKNHRTHAKNIKILCSRFLVCTAVSSSRHYFQYSFSSQWHYCLENKNSHIGILTWQQLTYLIFFLEGGGELIQYLCIYVLAPWASLPLTPDNNCFYRTIYSYSYFGRSTGDSYKTNKNENVIYTCYYLPSQRLGPTSPHLYSSPVAKHAAFCLDRLTILYLRFGGSREEHL